MATAFDSLVDEADGGFRSKLLNEIVLSLPKLKVPMRDLLGDISLKDASQGNKVSLWKDTEKFPELVELELVRIIQCQWSPWLTSSDDSNYRVRTI